MPQDTPSRKLDQYIVRFPDGMRDQLKAVAAKHGRSLNAEIIARLAYTLGVGVHFEPLTTETFDKIFGDVPETPPPPSEPPPDRELSDFEREYVQASHQLMMRLLRKHGRNPIDPSELIGDK